VFRLGLIARGSSGFRLKTHGVRGLARGLGLIFQIRSILYLKERSAPHRQSCGLIGLHEKQETPTPNRRDGFHTTNRKQWGNLLRANRSYWIGEDH